MVWGGGLYRYDEGREIFEQMPKIGEKDNPIKMIQDHDGRYWVCTWGDGFFRFNPEYSDSRAFIKQNIGAPATVEEDIICFDVIQDNNDGLLWLLSYHKLCVLEVNDEGNVEEAKIEGLNVFNRTFSNILKDRNGNLWIGAFDAGYSVRFRNKNLNNYPLGQIIEKYDMDVNINALGIDDDGIFWINQGRV